jgi:hypothetical protein
VLSLASKLARQLFGLDSGMNVQFGDIMFIN